MIVTTRRNEGIREVWVIAGSSCHVPITPVGMIGTAFNSIARIGPTFVLGYRFFEQNQINGKRENSVSVAIFRL